MVTITLALALAAAVFTAPAPAGANGGTVDFDGSGWGHGVGLSQYGAYGRATDGQSSTQILGAYYEGATSGQLGDGLPTVDPLFVNVGSDRLETTLTILDGPGSGNTGVVITRLNGAAPPQTATLGTGDRAVIVDTTPGQGQPGGCAVTLTIAGIETVWDVSEPATAGDCDVTASLVAGSVAQPDHLVRATNCRTANCTFAWGTQFMVIDNGSGLRTVKDKIGGGCSTCPEYPGFDLVVELTIDDYVRGIAEVPFSWPAAALEAQAIAARSYAASFAIDDHRDEGCFCDVRNDSSWQVYAGWVGNRTAWQQWDAAAIATAGKVLTHPAAPASDIVRAYYSSSNGGVSEASGDKWGTSLPYLVPVDDPWSLVSANPRASWTFTESADEVIDRVWGTSSTLDLVSVEVVATNASGSAKTIRFTGAANNGSLSTKDVSSSAVSSWFGLYSWYFTADDGDLAIIPFTDLDGNIHADNIEYLHEIGAALACDDGPTLFCPDDPMRREDLAAFMVRALELPPATTDYFVDDDGYEHEDDINALMQAGITRGCNPPDNDRFCPDATVTRGQSAAFLVRAWSLTDSGPGNRFVDDDDSVFEADIDRIATAKITLGCNPPANDRYCPNSKLSRAHMSSFLARALRDLGVP
jgi:SpoIID/LytB domain protein